MQQSEHTVIAKPARADYARIATEEAFAPPEMLKIYRQILDGPVDLWG